MQFEHFVQSVVGGGLQFRDPISVPGSIRAEAEIVQRQQCVQIRTLRWSMALEEGASQGKDLSFRANIYISDTIDDLDPVHNLLKVDVRDSVVAGSVGAGNLGLRRRICFSQEKSTINKNHVSSRIGLDVAVVGWLFWSGFTYSTAAATGFSSLRVICSSALKTLNVFWT